MNTPDMTDSLSDELISRLESSEDIGILPDSEMFDQENIFGEGEHEPDDVIIVHMDIRQPLTRLRNLLEKKIGGINLKSYSFWLQDAQILEPHKNLVDQCVKGEGFVQVNSQIQTINKRINIVDVLKPTDDALEKLKEKFDEDDIIEEDDDSQLSQNEESSDMGPQDDGVSKLAQPCLNWFMDNKFRKEQIRLKIPEDPREWTIAQVKHWLQYAVRQFNLTRIKLGDWNITGQDLCQLTHEKFTQKVPIDPGNVFWTHLELLRKCKFAAVTQPSEEDENNPDANITNAMLQREQRIMKKPAANAFMARNYMPTGPANNTSSLMTIGSGNNGQVQLWQFLLDILTDREYRDIISWVGCEGEFKLTDPEGVARLWGERKNKPAMNYEKLSRALRYYYDGDMISKVPSKRFAYKFDCDLKSLIGYDAQELSNLVNENATVPSGTFFLNTRDSED